MAISLSTGVRQSLQSLQATSVLAQTAQRNLATGKRVNSAIDNPTNFFTALNLNNRAEAFSGLLDGISNSVQTVKAASTGIDGVTKLVKAAQAVVKQARSTTDAALVTTLSGQYDDLQDQIDQLAKDSGFNGINLLGGDDLKTVFNEKTGTDQSSLTTTGETVDSGTYLALSTGTVAFASNTTLDTESDKLTSALTTLSSLSSTLGANLSVIQARQDFSKNLIDTLKIGADNLVNADPNEEGANLLALQTRQQLAQTSLSLSSQADQSVLRLF